MPLAIWNALGEEGITRVTLRIVSWPGVGTEEAHQGLKDQAKMAAVLKGAEEADAVELAGGVQPAQLVQDALLGLAGSKHSVISPDHLDGHLLEVAIIQALGLVPGSQNSGEDSLAVAGKHFIPPIHHLPNLQHARRA